MLRWFRRQKPQSDERVDEQRAPTATPEPVTEPPAQAGPTESEAARKRRGRNNASREHDERPREQVSSHPISPLFVAY